MPRANDALRSVARLGAAAQNALEIARFGGLDVDQDGTPFTTVAEVGIGQLRRYGAGDRPAVLLVPPLMLTAEVWDISPATSAVAALLRAGLDPWVVDFGSPEDADGGLTRTLTDHVLTVDRMVDTVRERTGRDVHLAGYSQGGMFCYQTAALRRSEGIASVITFGSPVDIHSGLPFGLPVDVIGPVADLLARTVLDRTSVPSWLTRTAFNLLDPVKTVRHRVDFVRQLADRDRLLAQEPQRRFLGRDGFTAYPGPALADLAAQFVAHNRMLSGGFVIDDRLVTLADLTCPILVFVGEVDELGRPAAVRAIASAAPRAQVHERWFDCGHFALVVGSTAREVTWPTVSAWIHRHEDASRTSPLLEPLTPLDADADHGDPDPGLHLGYGLDLVADVSLSVARSLARGVAGTTRAARSSLTEAAEQLPRLLRLERSEGDARLSLGRVLDEQARRHPDQVFFLFEDRAHTYARAKDRIDAVVRGLLHLGVRHGEHVGVLMATRPSALAVVAALSRIGAVAVMLRPDGSLERELELGRCTRIVADPEHGLDVAARTDLDVLVLGGGGRTRDLGPRVIDLERIDPDEVEVPAWYRPNPGRASDLAFVTFSGEGEDTTPNLLTNRRWALGAYGTASAASLSPRDTVYGLSPIHHPSGLLTSVGGAVAGGARLALSPGFDPDRFWEEVRRYGVTVVAYTWAMLLPLLTADPHPAARHHPVRLFVGSGMPVSLWQQASRRFAPARVLELYASTEGEAVLVNLTGEKVGAKGRRLPGAVDVEVAAFDPATGLLQAGEDGFVRRADDDEVGLLVSRVPRAGAMTHHVPFRGLFAPGDAWLATGDLFRRDANGDHWLVDRVHALVDTEHGFVAPGPVEDALGRLPGVLLAVAYPLPAEAGPDRLAAALRVEGELTPEDLERALRQLPPEQRPDVVRVVDEVPLTTWFRPRRATLAAAGLPDDRGWRRDGDRYLPLTGTGRQQLLGAAG